MLTNPKLANYSFLEGMYRDGYFPAAQVDKVKAVLLNLCARIEAERPSTPESLFKLTHAAVEQINDLQAEFEENESEIETVAREVIAEDFRYIVEAYGFTGLDLEDVIAPRDW